MSESSTDKVVYDCNVFLQFLVNPDGPSGRCVTLAMSGAVALFVCENVLAELRELPEKPFCIERGITDGVVEEYIADLLPRVTFLTDVPQVFSHPIDADDSCYVNLALAADAKLIVSRDKHVLNLMNESKPWSKEFRQRFPTMKIVTPEKFLQGRGKHRST